MDTTDRACCCGVDGYLQYSSVGGGHHHSHYQGAGVPGGQALTLAANWIAALLARTCPVPGGVVFPWLAHVYSQPPHRHRIRPVVCRLDSSRDDANICLWECNAG